MTRRRFYAPPGSFAEDGRSITLEREEARHLRDVLRLKRGDEVFVFDGEGHEYRCRVGECGRASARLEECAEVAPARDESKLGLTLALALLKGEKFDLVVQKTTELGVSRIVPVMTKLADVRLRDEGDASRRVARWRRVAMEAAKQSGRARVPTITEPVAFSELIRDSGEERHAGARYLMFTEREGHGLDAAFARVTDKPAEVFALIGSEGGWTDEEIAEARASGWSIVTLGGRTLRAETAAIAITALLQHRLGDLR